MNNVTNIGVTLQNRKISVLKYADDVVLIATDAEVLHKALRALEQFCADNRLTVNTDKSKLMCFAKKRPTMLPILYYEENQLKWITEFKYLGGYFLTQKHYGRWARSTMPASSNGPISS